MLCIQCGTDNDDRAKYCVSCNALMPVAAPTGNPVQSSIDLDEMVEYPVPESHYQSPILQQLAWYVHEFMEEEADFEPVIEAYEAFREIFEGFRGEVPRLEEICYSQEGILEDDPTPTQLKYLIAQAETMFKEGEVLFEGYLDKVEALGEEDDFPDPQPLVEGTKKWLTCNDNVCIAFEFLSGRYEVLTELVDELKEELEGFDPASADQQTAPIPTDRTDIT